MSSPLEDWHSRLDRHFAGLRAQRGDRPLFALEHGLNAVEREELDTAIRTHIRSAPPSSLHGLPWIVYAAEIGYGYAGDEYWQTFEQKTPGWTTRGSREWVRDRYKWFHQMYGGAAPAGPWAGQFTIICWPITHAILPTDLQRQLAHILYDLRDSFSAELFESPTTLGEFISARSFNASSRFRNLAQESQLVGQIAAALLLQGQYGTAGLLHPASLTRISSDLDRERVARLWLSSARRAAQERATVRGLYFARGTLGTARRPEDARAEIAALGIEPRTILRRGNPPTSWEVCLEIPDLSHLLLRFPAARAVLAESRCSVAGAKGPPLARGQFLYGSKRVVLSRWPRHDEVLLKFERRDAQMDFLLRTECMLRPAPLRLFRIASDGVAYESRGLRVRPSENYILVRETAFARLPHVTNIALSCQGVHAVSVSLPDTLTPEWQLLLKQLGLSQARTLEVWPAGIAASQWDGEGHGEWLATERPCLGIRTDHSVSAVIVSMGDSAAEPLVLDKVEPGKAEFIELPRLPVGLHRLRFSTRRSDTGEESIGDLDVLMRIREPRPWSPAAGSQGPLLARIDPPVPTLEQVWEGAADIAIDGPPGRHIRCNAAFIDSSRTRLASKTLPPLSLPVDSQSWTRHFKQHCRGDKHVAEAYDAAKTCELRFEAEELGVFTLRCDREFAPLRWIMRLANAGYVLRLLNDSGAATPPTVSRRAFELPLVEETMDERETYPAGAAGGLYVARQANAVASIVVPPIVNGFADFVCKPRINCKRSAASTLDVCAAAELWSRAKLTGNVFSSTRQRQVLSAMDRHVAAIVCGDEWMRIEQAFRAGKATIGYLQRAVWQRYDDMEAGVRIRRRYVELAAADLPSRTHELAEIARDLGVAASTDEARLAWIAQFALRITSDPASVASWSRGQFHAGFAQLQACPALARAARCLVIAIDHHLGAQGEPHELYASWRWQ